MKLKLFTIFLFILAIPTYACDVCSCYFGGAYLGILPQFDKNYIGINYYYRFFHSTHTSIFNTTQFSEETLQTIELRGKLNASNKLSFLFLIPYNKNIQVGHDDEKLIGLGDVTLIGSYTLFDDINDLQNSKENIKDFVQVLKISTGLKLPTGKFNVSNLDNELNSNLQVGNGCTDLLLNASYNCRYDKYGLNLNSDVKFSNESSNGLSVGNSFSSGINLFYLSRFEENTILPIIGCVYEHYGKSTKNGNVNLNSGGNTFLTNLGFDLYFNSLTIGFNFQYPFSQFSDNSLSKLITRFNTNIYYKF